MHWRFWTNLSLLTLLACGDPPPPPAPTPEPVASTAPAALGAAPDPIAGILDEKRAAEPPAEPEAGSEDPLSVWMEMEIDVEKDAHPTLSGRTNLPDDTLLVVHIESDGEKGFSGEEIARVEGGSFAAGPFGPEGGLESGGYTARVSMALPRSQPASVKAAIGEDGERLVGELVERSEMGLTVELSESFKVTGSDSVLGGAEAREEGQAIYDGLKELAALGREMQPLRTSRDPNCGGREADAQSQLRALLKRIQRLPPSLKAPFSAAANDLTHCLRCEGTAMEMCTIADLSLKRCENQLSSVSQGELRAAE